MSTKDFATFILVDKTPIEAFNAIKDFRAWWTNGFEGRTDNLGETFFYHYKDSHMSKIKLMEEVPGKKLVYHVLANYFSFLKEQTEWVNTKLIFEISKEGNQTKVTFIHEGLVPENQCYKPCNDAWTMLIGQSLKSLIETGKGQPVPQDTKGVNMEFINEWKTTH